MVLIFTVIFVALLFTYTNGFHDTANSIATVVGTKVLTPRQAILLAAVTNLIGAFFGAAADANPLARFAKIDLAEVVLFHQLDELADSADLKHAVGAGLIGHVFGFTHRGIPLSRRWFRWRLLAGRPAWASSAATRSAVFCSVT